MVVCLTIRHLVRTLAGAATYPSSVLFTPRCEISRQGEELCISYGNGRLWFPDADDVGDRNDGVMMRDGADRDEDDRRGGTLGELELSGLSGIEIDVGEEEKRQGKSESDVEEDRS